MNRCSIAMIPILLVLVLLSGCANLPISDDAPNVRVTGLEPLPAEGLEVRFALKLRVQNPNENALAYDGISVSLDLNGQGLASGVSNASGEIPRFSEDVLTIPVTISALSLARQLFSRALKSVGSAAPSESVVYTLKGKLGAVAGKSGATRFSDEGELSLFPTAAQSE